MQTHDLKQLIEQTFATLACPANGQGMYAELEKALLNAYNLGKAQQGEHFTTTPIELPAMLGIRA